MRTVIEIETRSFKVNQAIYYQTELASSNRCIFNFRHEHKMK